MPVIIELDSEFWPDLQAYLEKELADEYDAQTARRGRRLFPAGLEQLVLSGEDLVATVAERRESVNVKMTLPVFDWASGFSYASCTCQDQSLSLEDRRCSHMWLVQYVMQEWLQVKLADMSAGDPTTGVSGLLGLMDEFLGTTEQVETGSELPDSPSAPGHKGPHERAIFVLNEDFEVAARIQKWSATGWSPGRLINWAEYLERRDLWVSDEHFRVAAQLQPMVTAVGSGVQADSLVILQQLVNTEILYWRDEPAQQVILVETPLNLKAQTEDQQLKIVPYLADSPVAVSDAATGWLMSRRAKAGQLYYQWVDEKTARFVDSLLVQTQGLPTEQKDLLLDYMVKLDQKIPVDLAEDLSADEEGEADRRLYLRLTPFASGKVQVEMLVRPVAGGSYFPPGSGPESVLSRSTKGRVVSCRRDFFNEYDQAQQLIERLELQQFPTIQMGRWLLPDEQGVLVILDRLQRVSEDEVVVEWPKHDWLQRGPDLGQEKIVLKVGDKRDWLGASASLEVEGQQLDLKDILKALRKDQQYIQLKDGRWARLTASLRERCEQLAEAVECEADQLRLNPAAAEKLEELEKAEAVTISEASKQWWQLKKRLQRLKVIDYGVPKDFQGTLRSYQYDGFKWLHRLKVWGMGACLADDMGLGKTIQTLAVLLKHRRQGPSLVIAPSSVIANWEREAQRFSPGLDTLVYRDTDRLEVRETFAAGQLILISYGLVLRDREKLARVAWNCLVIDEAQAIKNARSQTAKAIQSLTRDWTLALSGTPVENHLGDLWSLFRTISPGLLGSWERFRRSYGFPILQGNDAARDRLRKRIQPFILRRLKIDYLDELPDKTQIDLRVSLSQAEREVYEAIRLAAVKKLEAQSDEDDEAGADQSGSQRLQILGALTRLRLAACHPQLVQDNWQAGSAKLELVLSLAKQIQENGHRVLIFSQFTRFLAMVATSLKQAGYRLGYLDGQTPSQQRFSLVDAFQRGDFEFFLISLKAGGTGLNLTRADYVIHLDPWWNPAVEDQATDRAYRMGQTNHVTVYRLITEHTIEDQITQLHLDKRAMAEAVLAQDSAITELTENDLKTLIQTPFGAGLQKDQTPAGSPETL
jgi:superfamily II DNA or RNA helicase